MQSSEKNSVQPFGSYLDSIYIQSHSNNTLKSYRNALGHFGEFSIKNYHATISDLVVTLKEGKQDPYKVLGEFVIYLDKLGKKPKSIKLWVGAAKGYLRHSGIKIYTEDFRQLVKLPKVRRYREEPLTREIIARLMRNLTPKLQAAVLVAVASGIRIGELVQLKISDIDFSTKPTTIRIRAETTKTRESREAYLTTEATNALKDYLRRYFNWQEGETNEKINEQVIFGPRTVSRRKRIEKKISTPEQIAESILQRCLLLHIREIPELNKLNENGVHMIHFHAFRKFCRTVVGNAVGRDFAEALIGHRFYLDTYVNIPAEERRKMYLKAEPYLTISDFAKIEKSLDEITEKYRELEQQLTPINRYMQAVKKALPSLVIENSS